MYEEIKKNIIKNFLNRGYLYTCGCSKSAIIERIVKNSIFTTLYDYNNDEMVMKLGDNVNIMFKLKWENKPYKNKLNNKETQHYKLISIE